MILKKHQKKKRKETTNAIQLLARRNSAPPAMSTPQFPLPPPSTPQQQQPPQARQSIPLLLPIFIIFFLFVCFLSVFLLQDLFHCLRHRRRRDRTPHDGDGRPHRDGDPGLDPVIISSFPTLPYSTIRGLQEGKCGAECAVCLSEFSGSDVIRLLTVCCHAFHPACIDSWLASHTTCPVCRSDLESPPDEAAVLAVREAVGGGMRDSHVILIEDEVKTSSRENSVEDEGRRERGEEVRPTRPCEAESP